MASHSAMLTKCFSGSADVDFSRLRDDMGSERLSNSLKLSLLSYRNERIYRVFSEKVEV